MIMVALSERELSESAFLFLPENQQLLLGIK